METGAYDSSSLLRIIAAILFAVLQPCSSLDVAAEQTVKREADDLRGQVGHVEVVPEVQHVAARSRGAAERGRVAACRQANDLRLTGHVLARGDEDRASKAKDARVVGHAVVPVDQIRGAAERAIETTAVREVRRGHADHAGLLACAERPKERLRRLPVEAVNVLGRRRRIAVGDRRLRRVVRRARSTELVVAVRLEVVRTTGDRDRRSLLNRVLEPKHDAEREHDHGLVAREHRTLLQVRLAIAFACDGEEIGPIADRAHIEPGGADQGVTERLVYPLPHVGQFGHICIVSESVF